MSRLQSPLLFMAAMPNATWRPSVACAHSRSQMQPKEEATLPSKQTMRKRIRTTTHQDVTASSKAADACGAKPARDSVSVVDAAIRAGAVKVLPRLVQRNISTLSYGSILRATSALICASEWMGVVDLFDAAVSNPGLRARFTSRLYTDFFFSLMKITVRSAALRGYEEYLKLTDADPSCKLMGPRAYNFLYVLLSRNGMVDEAMHVESECKASGYYMNRYSYNAFLSACAKAYRIADAFETLRAMAENNIPPDVVSFNVLISCCIRSGDLDIALGILYRMKEWGIHPDIYSYNSVINGLRKNKMLEEAFGLVARMELDAEISGRVDIPLITDIKSTRSTSLEANKVSSNGELGSEGLSSALTLIKALTSARRGDAGVRASKTSTISQGPDDVNSDERSFDEPASVVDSSEHELSGAINNQRRGDDAVGVKPDLVTYNTLISGIASMEVPDYERAMAVKKHFESRGIKCNEVTYNALMAVAARANMVDDTFKVYDEMVSRGLRPNCECYTTLITLCGRANMIHRAFEIHDHMILSGIKPSVITFNALLSACRCAADGNYGDAALKVLGAMRESEDCTPDVITFSTVIDALGRAGQFRKVHEVLEEMAREGIEPNLVTYTSVISAFTRAGDLNGALRILKDMESHGIRPNVYTFSSLIHGAGRRGEFEKALQILDMMRARGVAATKITYNMLLQLAVRSGTRTFLDRVVEMLGEDKRLKGTAQHQRIVELSQNDELFTGEGRTTIAQMSAAIGECVALPKPRVGTR